ncbi:MAG: xanthine dehydrogenase YagR molybdenum-binding subunit [Alphaproteobacteria bacterium]|nr:xanthine dehydrogenase YagR molybdenum-binding subunit [Alphaproteobacteria bacterium]
MTFTAFDVPRGNGALLGFPLARADGVAKVTGQADYALDHDLAGSVHAVVVESIIPSGHIKKIDATMAQAMPGVLRILTHADAIVLKTCTMVPAGSVMESFRPLQDDRIHYNGQPIALVIAETLEQATEAARHLQIEYDARAAVADIDDPAGAVIDVPGSASSDPGRGDAKGALASAAVRIESVYTTPREYNSPMEPLATIAVWNPDGSLTVWQPSQWVEGARSALSEWFGLAIEKVRVISPFVGGGFGAKVTAHPDSALAAMAARLMKRPVKLALTRSQNFTGHGLRPAIRQKLTLGATTDGKLVALTHENINETSLDDVYVEGGAGSAKVMYAIPNFSATQKLVRINSFTPSWKRAPGEAIGAFALESAMDELADALKLDPIELRLRNWADQDPETQKPWSTRRLREAYEAGARAFGWERRSPKPRSMRDGRQLIGWGMAGGGFPNVHTPAEAHVTILADGTVEVASSGAEIGNGTYTIVAQTAADVLGVPFEHVRVRLGDTSLPRAPVAGVSQIANLLTGAVHKTAQAAREELLTLAANHKASPFKNMRVNDFKIKEGIISPADGSAKGVAIAELMYVVGRDRIEVQRDTMPPGRTSEEDRRAAFGSFKYMLPPTATHSTYAWCAQFVEVRVDEDYGTVRVSRMVGAFDCGRLYNPRLAESQWKGGMIMGLGEALLEAVHTDRRYARITNNNLAEYVVPVNADIPNIEVISVGEPDKYASALGGKTVGEIGVVGAAAAIANAVFHATGKRVRDLPITMEKLM